MSGVRNRENEASLIVAAVAATAAAGAARAAAGAAAAAVATLRYSLLLGLGFGASHAPGVLAALGAVSGGARESFSAMLLKTRHQTCRRDQSLRGDHSRPSRHEETAGAGTNILKHPGWIHAHP